MRALVLAVSVALFATPVAFAQQMYWTEKGNNKIHRANLDGSFVEDLIEPMAPTNLEDIALDVVNRKMYWTDRGGGGGGAIQRANLDGTGVEILVSSLVSPRGIALDVDGGKVYWTEGHRQEIKRANLDGSHVEDIVTTELDFPADIALSPGNRRIYWTDYATEKIQYANLDGSGIRTVLTSADGLGGPLGIALDLAAGKLYWSEGLGHGRIRRANLDGTNIEDVVSGLIAPSHIALDLLANKVYWADPVAHNIARSNLDGSGFEILLTEVNAGDPLNGPFGIALEFIAADCNDNGIADATDIAMGTSSDCTGNGIADECEPDCNGNGVADSCDIAGGTSGDCTSNGLPDECEPDCNVNGIPDICEVSSGIQQDCNSDFVPDECQIGADCNGNAIPDECEIADRPIRDCNDNGILDTCELADGTSNDCNGNHIPDDCDRDCNSNGAVDECDINAGLSVDLNANLVPDECEAAEAKIYWSGYRKGNVYRANLDGTFVEHVTKGAFGVAIDDADARIYVADYYLIARANLNGTDVETLATAGIRGVTRTVALDLSNRKLYWSDVFNNSIYRLNLDGSDAQLIVSGISDAPYNIALDPSRGEMFFGSSKISKANLNGTDVQEFVSEDQFDGFSRGMVLHTEERRIYWTDQINRRIRRVDLETGLVEDVITDLVGEPMAIAIDELAGTLYWGEHNPDVDESVEGAIMRADLDGTAIEEVVRGRFIPTSIALDVDKDCNGNGILDSEDIASGMRMDADCSGVPDECESGIADCNLNGTPDRCEIVAGMSADCDRNRVPDECDPDCNGNGFVDACDIADGISEDCNRNRVPDSCDMATSEDCNANGRLDSCDLDDASLDEDNNCIPDECDPNPSLLAELNGLANNRYISFVPGAACSMRAIRVASGSSSESLWVGLPQPFPDEGKGSFMAAALQCEPYYWNWSEFDLVFVYGATIVPRTVYTIQSIDVDTDVNNEDNYSALLVVTTAKWGDVAEPFAGDNGAGAQPDFNDVAALVDKFTASPTAPIKARAQLQPNVPDPSKAVDFSDISAVVDAFTGADYPFAGPSACP